jgi:hypothetical protein
MFSVSGVAVKPYSNHNSPCPLPVSLIFSSTDNVIQKAGSAMPARVVLREDTKMTGFHVFGLVPQIRSCPDKNPLFDAGNPYGRCGNQGNRRTTFF